MSPYICVLQVLHVGRQLEVTRALHNVLERSFPEEYEARRRETLEALEPPRDHTAPFPIPLFVMQCIMPGAHLGSYARASDIRFNAKQGRYLSTFDGRP